jgi:predicted TIM-barrel fold metal-dependent hydrolase
MFVVAPIGTVGASMGGAVQAEDMILVSVDDHVVEPPHLFRGLLPARLQDLAPEVITTQDGANVWTFNGTVIPNVGLSAGRHGAAPISFEEMPPGCFDIDERVKDMNAAGILGSMCFPSFPGLAGRLFTAADDKDLALAVTRAYNDWHIDQWCGSYPGRFIPMALPIIWDPELCAHEVVRVADKGCRAMTFTENPVTQGFPSFHHEFWDPLWRALSDTGVVMSVHLGFSGHLSATPTNAPAAVMTTLQPMNICQVAADLLWSRVIKQFPDVRFALSEGATGWIPYFLDRIDLTYRTRRLWMGQTFGGKLPSEVFRERFLAPFTADRIGVKLRHDIGIDNIAWQCEYPHHDPSWPTAADELERVIAEVPDDETDKITFENACRWFSFDPFARRPRQLCTVGALRDEAAIHDVSVDGFDQQHSNRDVGHPLPTLTSLFRG